MMRYFDVVIIHSDYYWIHFLLPKDLNKQAKENE